MWLACPFGMQGEMINDSGTMTGGGGKPRGGRLRLGSGAPRPGDQRAAAAELDTAEKQEHASAEVPLLSHICHCPCTVGCTQSAEPNTCESACVTSAESKHFIFQSRLFTFADCLSFHSASFQSCRRWQRRESGRRARPRQLQRPRRSWRACRWPSPKRAWRPRRSATKHRTCGHG